MLTKFFHALWDTHLHFILVAMGIATSVGLVIIVIDDATEGLYAFCFILLWLLGSYSLFKRQQVKIKKLEGSLVTEQELSDKALSLLTADINRDLQTLTNYLETVRQRSESSSDPTLRSLALATAAIELNAPAWSCPTWQTQMPSLMKALSTDQLQEVRVIYSQLEEISAILSRLEGLMGERQDNLRAGKWPDGAQPVLGMPSPLGKFDKNAPELWDSLERIARTLIEEGNPLECRGH